ncbi:MAG: hypothetical protein ABII12_18320 [Planctomycetota bacterium]
MLHDIHKPALLVMAMILVGGCGKGTGGPTVLNARAQPYVPDLPVPIKFERDERTSRYTYTAGNRSVKDIYQGKTGALAVRNFYAHNMPLAGWELVDEALQNAVYLLNYKKGDERCEIRIERTPAGLRGTFTRIQATIGREGYVTPTRTGD